MENRFKFLIFVFKVWIAFELSSSINGLISNILFTFHGGINPYIKNIFVTTFSFIFIYIFIRRIEKWVFYPSSLTEITSRFHKFSLFLGKHFTFLGISRTLAVTPFFLIPRSLGIPRMEKTYLYLFFTFIIWIAILVTYKKFVQFLVAKEDWKMPDQ